MRGIRSKLGAAIAFLGLAVLAPDAAEAYIGPGSGLSAIGSVLAVLAAFFFAIVGFVWYPIKRIVRLALSRRNRRSDG